MKVFKLPDEIDEILTIQFLIIFVIGFMINVLANGNATLVFFHDEYGVSPGDDSFYQDYKTEMISQYASTTLSNIHYSFWVSHFLYWILSPLVNFYYAFFRFRKLSWE